MREKIENKSTDQQHKSEYMLLSTWLFKGLANDIKFYYGTIQH